MRMLYISIPSVEGRRNYGFHKTGKQAEYMAYFQNTVQKNRTLKSFNLVLKGVFLVLVIFLLDW